MPVQFAHFSANLENNISASDTSIDLTNVVNFPTLNTGDHANLSLEDANGNIEVVKVTAVNGNELTVERGLSGNPRQFPQGSLAELRNDPITFTEIVNKIFDERGGSGGGGVLNEIHEAKYVIPAASNQSITVAQAGGRNFNDIRTFTGATPNTDTHTSRLTNGIRIDQTGFYNIELQLSIQLTTSAAGDWGISLIRSNGLTGAQEVIHSSAVFAAHTDALTGGVEDFIQTLNLTLREFNQGDFIYASVSFGSSESSARIMNYNISPSPTESFIMIRRFDVGIGTSTGGLSQAQALALINSNVENWAIQSNSARVPASKLQNLTDLDAKGVGELNDGDRMLVEDENDMSKDRTTVGALTAHVNENLEGEKVVDSLTELQGANRLPATAIKDLPSGGGGGLDQNAVDARIRTLRPNAFTNAEELKLAGLSRIEDKAIDTNLETKNAVIQKEIPRPITWEYDNAAGEWQTSEFNANTIDDTHITCSVEYGVVGDSGTATNRGRYYLTFEGTTNAITSAFPGFTIAEMILKLPSDNAFMVPLEVDPDIANGASLRATSVNPSNPTDLPNPSSNNPNDVNGTIDFILTDAKGNRITAYENAWKQRSTTLITDTDIQTQSHAVASQLISTAVKEYARTGQRKIAATDLQIKPEEAVNAFEGNGWNPTGGVTTLQAAIFTASNIVSQGFQESRTQGPHLTNNYVGIRIALADKDNLANLRLYIGENDGEDYHTVYPATGWTHLIDSSGNAYYVQQIVDHPAGDYFGVQSFESLRLDDEAATATVDATLQAGTGLTKTTDEGKSVTLSVTRPFTESDERKLDQLNNGFDDVSGVTVTAILESGDVIADRRFGQTPKGTFNNDTGSAQARLLEVVVGTDGLTISLGGPKSRFTGFIVRFSDTQFAHLDSAYNVSEDDPNVTEYDIAGDFTGWLMANTATVIQLLRPLTDNNYLPNNGTEDQYATPDSNGDIVWKDIPLASTGAHVTTLVDKVDIGVNIADPQTDRLGIPTYLPQATLNLTNTSGVFIVRTKIRISANTITNLGFSSGTPGDQTVTRNDSFTASDLRETSVFVVGGTQEGIKDSQDIYSGSTLIGTIDTYHTRLANGQIGYYASFDSNQQGPASGTATIQVNLELILIQNDTPQASGGGASTFLALTDTPNAFTGQGGKYAAVNSSANALEFVDPPTGSGTLTQSHFETVMTPSRTATSILADGTVEVVLGTLTGDHVAQGITIANQRMVFARENHYDIDVSLELSMLTNPAQNQGVRGYFDIQMYKSTGSTGTKNILESAVYTAYLRASENSPGRGQSPAAQRFAIACNVKLAAGDAVGIQVYARHLQTGSDNHTFQIKVEGTNSEVRVVSDEYSLS